MQPAEQVDWRSRSSREIEFPICWLLARRLWREHLIHVVVMMPLMLEHYSAAQPCLHQGTGFRGREEPGMRSLRCFQETFCHRQRGVVGLSVKKPNQH